MIRRAEQIIGHRWGLPLRRTKHIVLSECVRSKRDRQEGLVGSRCMAKAAGTSISKQLDVAGYKRRGFLPGGGVLNGPQEIKEGDRDHIGNTSFDSWVSAGNGDGHNMLNDRTRDWFDAHWRRIFLRVGAQLAAEPKVYQALTGTAGFVGPQNREHLANALQQILASWYDIGRSYRWVKLAQCGSVDRRLGGKG